MTAVILAGGRSTRMGRDKLELMLDGETLLQSAVRRFGGAFDRVLVSVASPDSRPETEAERVADIYAGCGPMAGLHAAMSRCGEDVFLAAADMPFAEPGAALRLMSLCGNAEACVITDGQGRYEPLFAFYRISLLPRLEQALRSGRRGMQQLLKDVHVREVSPRELGETWSDRLLINVNDPADYERLCLELKNDK